MQPTWVPIGHLSRAKVEDLAPGDLVLSTRPGAPGVLNTDIRVDLHAPVGLRKCLLTLQHESLLSLTLLRPDDGYAWNESCHLALRVRVEINIGQSRPAPGFSDGAIGQLAILRSGGIRLVAGQFIGSQRRAAILVNPEGWTVDIEGGDIEAHYPEWRIVAEIDKDRRMEISFPAASDRS